jgi:hypothetical protein
MKAMELVLTPLLGLAWAVLQHDFYNHDGHRLSQYDGHCGTITLPSEKHKIEALQKHGTEWRFDDIFNGVTILPSPVEPEIEYDDLFLLVWCAECAKCCKAENLICSDCLVFLVIYSKREANKYVLFDC